MPAAIDEIRMDIGHVVRLFFCQCLRGRPLGAKTRDKVVQPNPVVLAPAAATSEFRRRRRRNERCRGATFSHQNNLEHCPWETLESYVGEDWRKLETAIIARQQSCRPPLAIHPSHPVDGSALSRRLATKLPHVERLYPTSTAYPSSTTYFGHFGHFGPFRIRPVYTGA